jgi:hypothetical protein
MPLIGYDTAPDASPAGGLLEGKLGAIPESPCIVLIAVGEAPIGLAWPLGYTAAYNPLRIYNETGVEVASEGVPVTLTGGINFEPSVVCGTQSSFRVRQVFKGILPPAN